MSDPAGRLLRLLSTLQARPTWTADELAERLDVTPRTVRRDVTRLRDLGYPVDADPGPLGGYRLGAGGSMPPLLLQDDEAVAVALGLRTLAAGTVPGLEDVAVAAGAKLDQVFPGRLRERLAALGEATVRLTHGGQPAVAPDTLVALAQGCARPERLRFHYEDASGRGSERDVEPFRLVQTEHRWYLVARDRDRDDWRTFRVDRLRDPVLTGRRFARTSEPDAAALVAEGMAVAAHPWHARVLLRVTPAEAAELVPRTVGSLEPGEGGTVMRIGGTLEWLAHYLAGLECDLEVLEPPELRSALADHAAKLLRAHS